MLWGVVGAATALPLLAVPQPSDPLALVTVHLTLLVAFGTALAFRLASLSSDGWFRRPQERANDLLTAIWIIVLTSGVVGLVTLVTSAALRYDPSLQFLQALSSLDIAWAAAAIVVGLGWWRGRRVAVLGAVALIIVCVWSIWRYLDIVGFGPNGSWIVDADRLFELVIPYDMGAALAALTALGTGLRSRQASRSD